MRRILGALGTEVEPGPLVREKWNGPTWKAPLFLDQMCFFGFDELVLFMDQTVCFWVFDLLVLFVVGRGLHEIVTFVTFCAAIPRVVKMACPWRYQPKHVVVPGLFLVHSVQASFF